MKILLFLTTLISLLWASVSVTQAINDPRGHDNNRYGIHIINPSDLDDAAALVNSSGGQWGYVTLVIREDQRDTNMWNEVFSRMSDLQLIPIVRIASVPENGVWRKLDMSEIGSWVTFLDSLNWPIVNRYVVVGNEPNHAKEWGGSVNPGEYADYLLSFSKAAKEKSSDFFILNAGFDASAPNGRAYMSEDRFIRLMIDQYPDIFSHIDGWSSHSYPNPAFSGSSTDSGRGTVRTYLWEIDLLESFGIRHDLPVFITETGWAHDMEGEILGISSYGRDRFSFRSTDEVSDELRRAFEEVWDDESVVAVTPFVLDHAEYPFENFSWRRRDGSFYKFYEEIQKLPKMEGNPPRANQWKVIDLYQIDDRSAIGIVENTGQVDWKANESQDINDMSVMIRPINTKVISPNETALAYIETQESNSFLKDTKLLD